jgi:hypothetical protein
MTTPTMPIAKALHVLAAFHTRDDDVTGFVVEMHPIHPDCNMTLFSRQDYLRAWEAVRAYVHMQTEPKR